MFTAVAQERFRRIARLLVEEKPAPDWFADIEYVEWHGERKDINFIPGAHPSDVLLVDDFEKYVRPGQESQWLRVDYFDYPYEPTDNGLVKMLAQIEGRVGPA